MKGEQLSELIQRGQFNLSIVAPRLIVPLKQLYEKCNVESGGASTFRGDTQQHMVLLNNIEITSTIPVHKDPACANKTPPPPVTPTPTQVNTQIKPEPTPPPSMQQQQQQPVSTPVSVPQQPTQPPPQQQQQQPQVQAQQQQQPQQQQQKTPVWSGTIKWRMGNQSTGEEEQMLQCRLLCKPDEVARCNVQHWPANQELTVKFIEQKLLTTQLKAYFQHSTVLDFDFAPNQPMIRNLTNLQQVLTGNQQRQNQVGLVTLYKDREGRQNCLVIVFARTKNILGLIPNGPGKRPMNHSL